MKTTTFLSRRRASVLSLLFLFFFCCTSGAYATTYYISPLGNDVSGNGTLLNPWRTLYKATSTVSGTGDIIHVNTGIYTETQQSALKVGVSIEGDGITSILRSSLTADWTEMLSLKSAEGTNGNQHISNVRFDGQNLSTFWGIYIAGRSNVSVHDISMVDFKDRGILFCGRNDNADAPPTFFATGNTFYNNTISNCAAYNLSTGQYGRGCLNIGGQNGMLIYNNTISQTSRPEGYNGWPIKYYNGGYIRGCKIYNNTLNKIPQGNWPGISGWDFAIELFNESGLEIYNNIITGGGIDLNYQTKGVYAYSVWIHDNTIQMPLVNTVFQFGITLEFGSEDVIIENNIIDKQSAGVVFTPRNTNTVKNIIIRKNLMSNIGISNASGSFVFLGGEGNTNYYNNIDIYNNTMIGNPVNRNYWGIDLPKNTAGYAKNINIKNNIIANTIAGGIVQSNVPTVIDSINISFNNLYNNGNSNNPVWNGTAPTHQTVINNSTVIPIFNLNYTLPIGSPLIDAGVFVGLPFAGVAPDRGYAEVNLALPVTLVDFTVTENKEKNLLQWKTLAESNSDHFSVERSSNGINYEPIGRVNATVFSSTVINYNFNDASPLKGINYYRLVMVDKDNSFEYSNTVAIARQTKGISILSANVFTGKKQITMNVTSAQNKKATLAVFDVNGRMFFNEPLLLQKGLNSINKNISLTAKGIYYIKLITDDEMQVKNILSTD